MKFKVEEHHTYHNTYCIAGDTEYYLNKTSFYKNIYSDLLIKEQIDPPKIIKEKFNAHNDDPFLFKNKEDAERFLEYLEPFIIMEILTTRCN